METTVSKTDNFLWELSSGLLGKSSGVDGCLCGQIGI